MHWLLVLDDCTDNGFSYFLKEKSQTSAVLIPFLKSLERHFGRAVKFIRCDNSGENQAFCNACAKEGLGIEFEFTAPGTPQQNGRVERKFATLWGRMRAMMAGADFSLTMKQLLWCEAANTVTDLDNFYATEGSSLGSAVKFWGKGYKSLIDSPKIFGEAVIVATGAKIKAKLSDRGKVCMWMGYAKNHKAGTYRLYNPATRKLIMSRDVVFLRKLTKDFEAEKLKNHCRTFKWQFSTDHDEDESDDESSLPELVPGEDSDSEEEPEFADPKPLVCNPLIVRTVPDD
ncbi:MAG: transposase family protein, partial [Desulfobacteraceae bacterium]|nr:transposase family protein [Desulfobacteraceae bacterium]